MLFPEITPPERPARSERRRRRGAGREISSSRTRLKGVLPITPRPRSRGRGRARRSGWRHRRSGSRRRRPRRLWTRCRSLCQKRRMGTCWPGAVPGQRSGAGAWTPRAPAEWTRDTPGSRSPRIPAPPLRRARGRERGQGRARGGGLGPLLVWWSVVRCMHTRGDPGGRSPPVLIQGWLPLSPPPCSPPPRPLFPSFPPFPPPQCGGVRGIVLHGHLACGPVPRRAARWPGVAAGDIHRRLGTGATP